MKKEYLALLLTMVLLHACKPQKKEDAVKKNIRSYLSKTMHDFKSYEPVEYGKQDSLYSSYLKTDRYKSLFDLCDEYSKGADEAIDDSKIYTYTNTSTAKYYLNKGKDCLRKYDSVTAIIKKEAFEFERKFIGYKVLHSFRGKNMNGATILTTEYFILDSLFNVVETEDLPKEKESNL